MNIHTYIYIYIYTFLSSIICVITSIIIILNIYIYIYYTNDHKCINVVGWRLVERRQLSCAFVPVGWGWVGWVKNVLFTLLLTRSCCYALHFVKYLPTRSWCYALHFFTYLPTRSWCYAVHFFTYLPTRSWCYAVHFFTYLPTRSWCYALHFFTYPPTCSWCYARHFLSFSRTFHCAPFPVICPKSREHNVLIAIGEVWKNSLDPVSLARWREIWDPSFLHPEIDKLVKQWLYRTWTPSSGPNDVYRNLTQVLKRMWNKDSEVWHKEIQKKEVACHRI